MSQRIFSFNHFIQEQIKKKNSMQVEDSNLNTSNWKLLQVFLKFAEFARLLRLDQCLCWMWPAYSCVYLFFTKHFLALKLEHFSVLLLSLIMIYCSTGHDCDLLKKCSASGGKNQCNVYPYSSLRVGHKATCKSCILICFNFLQ
jgi:hypothetical protein